MRILYVEDHTVFAFIVIEEFLAEHDVFVVSSVAEAVAAAAVSAYDVILVDYDLPDGKGTEVIEFLHSIDFAGRIIGTSSKRTGNAALQLAGAHAACGKAHMHEIGEVLAAA